MRTGSSAIRRRLRKPLLYRTVLGPGTRLRGDLTFEDSLCIMGSFEGTIRSEGYLRVDRGAVVRATSIRCGYIDVEGTVDGSLEADERVDLGARAAVTGNISSPVLSMADGASYEGRVRILSAEADGFDN